MYKVKRFSGKYSKMLERESKGVKPVDAKIVKKGLGTKGKLALGAAALTGLGIGAKVARDKMKEKK